MTTAIAHREPASLAVADGGWTRERIDLVKNTVCPQGIPDNEFSLFIEQCKRSGLDPLIKQAFCVKRRQNIGSQEHPRWIDRYEFQPGETGMLARAEQFPDYRGITAAAVYVNDEVQIDPSGGVVSHRFKPGPDRGALLGAWALLRRVDRDPIVVWLDVAAYADNRSPMWKGKGATMITKCARVAALRVAYPAAFGGLYLEEEMRADDQPQQLQQMSQPQVQQQLTEVIDAEVVTADQPGPSQQEEQIQSILALLAGCKTEEDVMNAGKIMAKNYPTGHPVRVATADAWHKRMAEVKGGTK